MAAIRLISSAFLFVACTQLFALESDTSTNTTTSGSGMLTIKSAMVKFNFVSPNKDSLKISGTIGAATGLVSNQISATVFIGTYQHVFVFNAKGQSGNTSNSLKFTGKLKQGVFTATPVVFTFSASRQTLFGALSSLGYTNSDVRIPIGVDLPVKIMLNGTEYDGDYTTRYTARAQKSGMAR